MTRDPTSFAGGEDERSRLLSETERDYVALVSAGAEAARLESTLERADREVTEREADSAALVVSAMRELVPPWRPAAVSVKSIGDRRSAEACSWKLLGNRSPHETSHTRLHQSRRW